MKATTILLAVLSSLGITNAAAATTSPWVGTWQADLTTLNPPDHSITSQTLTITATADGYSMHEVLANGGNPMNVDWTVITDGKPHTNKSAFGGVTTTCNSPGAKIIKCSISIAGSGSNSDLTLSADGKTITETDVNEVTHEHYSSQTSASIVGTTVSKGPTTNQHQQTSSTETQVVVYRKQ